MAPCMTMRDALLASSSARRYACEGSHPLTLSAFDTFTTLGAGPAVSRVGVANPTQTGAQATVTSINLEAGYRLPRAPALRRVGVQVTGQLQMRVATRQVSVTFDLPNLKSDTAYEIEATIADDFGGQGVQRTEFTTLPPLVSGIDVPEASVTENEASATVRVTGPNGSEVFLRFRTGPEDWTPLEAGIAVAEDETGATFELEGLIAGTRYEVEASYDNTSPRAPPAVAASRRPATRPRRRSRAVASSAVAEEEAAVATAPYRAASTSSGPSSKTSKRWTAAATRPRGCGRTARRSGWSTTPPASATPSTPTTSPPANASRRASSHSTHATALRAGSGPATRGSCGSATAGRDHLFAYDLETGERIEDRDIALDGGKPRRARHLVRRRHHVGAQPEPLALRVRPRERRAAGRVRTRPGQQRPAGHLVRRRHDLGLRPRREAPHRLPSARAALRRGAVGRGGRGAGARAGSE